MNGIFLNSWPPMVSWIVSLICNSSLFALPSLVSHNVDWTFIKEVVRSEVLKLLYVGIICPISDSQLVNLIHVVPKKYGITIIKNIDNEIVPTKILTGWHVSIDYRKLSNVTRNDHLPLPFIDHMLERLNGHSFYCFLDVYSRYNQIPITPKN